MTTASATEAPAHILHPLLLVSSRAAPGWDGAAPSESCGAGGCSLVILQWELKVHAASSLLNPGEFLQLTFWLGEGFRYILSSSSEKHKDGSTIDLLYIM